MTRERELLRIAVIKMRRWCPVEANITIDTIQHFLDEPSQSEAPHEGWKRVLGDDLPDGAPVDPGTTLYAFDNFPGHWEYRLPPLPGVSVRPPKPKECEVACPPQQVCDHCQWPPSHSDKLHSGDDQ